MNDRSRIAEYVRREKEIPGNIEPLDIFALSEAAFLQTARGIAGNVLEIGAFRGKSASLLGLLMAPGEELVVCDLFGLAPEDPANMRETNDHYHGLALSQFTSNYRRFHSDLPVIHQCASADLAMRLAGADTFRLIHVDGSHLYDPVRTDIAIARAHLADRGIVVFDDYRAGHAPGVAAAVWEEVATGALVPLWLTAAKFYGSWVPPDAAFMAELHARAKNCGINFETVRLCGHDVTRFDSLGRHWRARLRTAIVPPGLEWVVQRGRAWMRDGAR